MARPKRVKCRALRMKYLDDMPPFSCTHVVQRTNIGGFENELICGAYAPEHHCHNRQCLEPVCNEHVRVCEECENEYHEGCMQIINRRFICKSCSLTLAECKAFGLDTVETLVAVPEAA